MARLNLCSGCGKNFRSATGHAEHRIGTFGVDRRCMTPEEMEAKNWTMVLEPVTRYTEGRAHTDMLETWAPPLTEQQKEWFAAMRASHRAEEEEDSGEN